ASLFAFVLPPLYRLTLFPYTTLFRSFQVMAWTLPTESGFYYMRDLAHTNPMEVGLDGNIDWEKDFIGKEALLKVKENGPEKEMRSEEHTSELQSRFELVCRLLLENKN